MTAASEPWYEPDWWDDSGCAEGNHDWQRDPDGPEEGLRCAACGITEAEDEAGR